MFKKYLSISVYHSVPGNTVAFYTRWANIYVSITLNVPYEKRSHTFYLYNLVKALHDNYNTYCACGMRLLWRSTGVREYYYYYEEITFRKILQSPPQNPTTQCLASIPRNGIQHAHKDIIILYGSVICTGVCRYNIIVVTSRPIESIDVRRNFKRSPLTWISRRSMNG